MTAKDATFFAQVLTKNEVVFEGPSACVSVPGLAGIYGFLPHHAPYLVGLGAGLIKVTPPSPPQEKPREEKDDDADQMHIPIKAGHALFYNNRCIICCTL